MTAALGSIAGDICRRGVEAMGMSPYLAVVLFGLALFGFAWMMPRNREADEAGDPAYERLLDELETENRELLDAMAKFKDEQDQTIKKLVRQIEDLERQMKSVAEQAMAAAQNAAAVSSQGDAREMNEPSASPAATPPDSAPAAPVRDAAEPAAAPAQPADALRIAPLSIRERYAPLLAMHSKGKSIEQIAKSAGMNKGEVQLILKLAQREAEQLA